MNKGDLYYSPKRNELVELASIDFLWNVPVLTFYNMSIIVVGLELSGVNRFPLVTVKEFKREYRKVGKV